MTHVVSLIQDFVSGIVFGNGWLALAGLLFVGLLTVVVRRSRGIRV
jgi:LPXTG-motif cell wall-anchored protein